MSKLLSSILLYIWIISIWGCGERALYDPSITPYAVVSHLDKLKKSNNDTLVVNECIKAYNLNNNHFLWLDNQRPKIHFLQYLQQLYILQDEGIDLNKLEINHIKEIHQKLSDWYKRKGTLSVDSLAYMDITLTQYYITAAKMLTFGNGIKVFKNSALNIHKEFYPAKNLVYALHQSEKFPALELYRPQHFLYVQTVFALKQWMLLSKDSSYLEHKNRIINNNHTLEDIQDVLKKELSSSSASLKTLLHKYQCIHNLQLTDTIDAETLQSLKSKPEDYRRKLKINMERLRLLNNNYPTELFWYNMANNRITFIRSMNIVFTVEADDTNHLVYNTSVYLNQDSLNSGVSYFKSDGSMLINFQHSGQQYQDLISIKNSDAIANIITNPILEAGATAQQYELYKIYLTVGQHTEYNVLMYLEDKLGWDKNLYPF